MGTGKKLSVAQQRAFLKLTDKPRTAWDLESPIKTLNSLVALGLAGVDIPKFDASSPFLPKPKFFKAVVV